MKQTSQIGSHIHQKSVGVIGLTAQFLSTGNKKQLWLDSFALNDDRNANRFPSFFLNVSAGEQ